MSEQQPQGVDQETGAPPPDPSTPAQSSQVPPDDETARQEQSGTAKTGSGGEVKSPDEESDEPREGGGYGNPNSPETPAEQGAPEPEQQEQQQ